MIREHICDVCQKMYKLGWVAANDGNVSVRLENGNVLVTPSGVSKGDVTPEMLVELSLSEGDTPKVRRASKNYKPSSEIKMHLRCYSEREDVSAVIHAHSPCATAFAIANKPLDDYSMMEAVLTIGSVPVAPYATPSTDEVGDSIAPLLQKHDVLLLQNHGALAIGADLMTAFNRMETLELWARTVSNAQALGGTQAISRENIEKLCSLRASYRITGHHPDVD